MKNKIYLIYLISSIILISCNNTKSKVKEEEIESPYIYVDVENGDKTKDTLEIMFSDVLTDSLKISKKRLQSICDNGVLYGDWNVKFKPTYKYDDGFLYFDEEENEILFSLKGTCENGYGVRDEITSIISFDTRGIMKNNEDDLPKIVSF
jgi:hypothetical protein